MEPNSSPASLPLSSIVHQQLCKSGLWVSVGRLLFVRVLGEGEYLSAADAHQRGLVQGALARPLGADSVDLGSLVTALFIISSPRNQRLGPRVAEHLFAINKGNAGMVGDC